MHYGSWPSDQVDHIDGNRANNHISNLRDVSASQNRRNQKLRSTNTSGHHGVNWCKKRKRWVVTFDRRTIGRFKEKDEAIQVRKEAEKKLGYHPNHGAR